MSCYSETQGIGSIHFPSPSFPSPTTVGVLVCVYVQGLKIITCIRCHEVERLYPSSDVFDSVASFLEGRGWFWKWIEDVFLAFSQRIDEF